MNQGSYKIISWNVNGYKSEVHQWLLKLTDKPDVIFLSETKRSKEDLSELFKDFTDYNFIVNSHCPAKWHGVAMLIRKDHTYQQVLVNMNCPVRKDTHDSEASTGRLIIIHLDNQIYLIGSYTPNSGRPREGPIKLEYRTKIWDPTFFQILELLRGKGPVMWLGDINTALDNIDVSNPRTMKKYAGFTLEERTNLRNLLNTGHWTDAWRAQNPTEKLFTWVGSPHKPDYGMRLDNFIVSDSLMPKIGHCFIIKDSPESSDHLPIGISYSY